VFYPEFPYFGAMGFLNNLRNAFRRDVPPTAQELTTAKSEGKKSDIGGWGGNGIRHSFSYGPTTDLEKLIANSINGNPIADPRTKLDTYDMMAAMLPCFSQAFEGFAGLLGTPKIICKDEGFSRMIEDEVWPGLFLHGEKVDQMSRTKGVEHVIASILDRLLRHGMGFYSMLDQEQQWAMEGKSDITGIRVHDPRRWEPLEFRPDYIDWQYMREGQIWTVRRDSVAGVATACL